MPTSTSGKNLGKQLFVVSAPSGAGKSTLTNRIVARFDNVKLSISCTTRPKRGDEQHGREYYFLNTKEFFGRIEAEDFIEYAQVHGHYYGTSREYVEQLIEQGNKVLFDIDVQGAANLKRIYPEATLIFIAPPSRAELERRLRERKTDDPKEIAKRLRNALGEMSQAKNYDYFIINDDLEKATHELEQIISGQTQATSGRDETFESLIAEFERDTPPT